jgi:hypothetical protein
MPRLTRRRYPERLDCWQVYYGDVDVGTIARRVGNPNDTDPWEWQRGFRASNTCVVSCTGPVGKQHGAPRGLGLGRPCRLPRRLTSYRKPIGERAKDQGSAAQHLHDR